MERFPLLCYRCNYWLFFPSSYMYFCSSPYLFNLTSIFLALTKRQLNVPSCLTLLPGQLQMLKEVVDKERSRRRTRTPNRAPPSPLSVPLVGEIPPWVHLQADCQMKPVQDCPKGIKLELLCVNDVNFYSLTSVGVENLCSFCTSIKITIEFFLCLCHAGVSVQCHGQRLKSC